MQHLGHVSDHVQLVIGDVEPVRECLPHAKTELIQIYAQSAKKQVAIVCIIMHCCRIKRQIVNEKLQNDTSCTQI